MTRSLSLRAGAWVAVLLVLGATGSAWASPIPPPTGSTWVGDAADPTDVYDPLNWNPETGIPDDDTAVTLDHTAVTTTLDLAGGLLASDTVAVGDGATAVAYEILSTAGPAEWVVSMSDAFVVRDHVTVNFKDVTVFEMDLLEGSTLLVQADGHLTAQFHLGLAGDLELDLPASPVGPYVVAEYGQLSGQFDDIRGLPTGWSIDYGTPCDPRITVVPEPACLAMLVLVGPLALRRRRGPAA